MLLQSSLNAANSSEGGFVFVGTLEPRKSPHTLVSLFLTVPELTSCKLELIGSADLLYMKTRLPFIHRLALALFSGDDEALALAIASGFAFSIKYKNIQWNCNASDFQRDQALVNAKAIVLPSLNEGYGIPVVEGMSLGVPVVVPDLPVFREISNDLIYYSSEPELASLLVSLSRSVMRDLQLVYQAEALVSDDAFSIELQRFLSLDGSADP
jgi:glycosyltransferase involved in cell wall biosynthesis